MTDDQLSELEECIDDACREAVRDGLKISPGVTFRGGKCCPLGALVRDSLRVDQIARSIGCSASDFVCGFDGAVLYEPTAMYAMGARFRARWQAGDYDPRGGKGGG